MCSAGRRLGKAPLVADRFGAVVFDDRLGQLSDVLQTHPIQIGLVGEEQQDLAVLLQRHAVVAETEPGQLGEPAVDVGGVHESEVVKSLALGRGMGFLAREFHQLDVRGTLLGKCGSSGKSVGHGGVG